MPTIKDIAQYAGVSHGTVSNVLNNRGNVSVEKMNLVKKAIEDLGYKVNLQAKNLRQGKTNQVAVIIPRVDLKLYVDLFVGINTTLSKEGYDVTIHSSNNSIEKESELVNTISASNPTAIVLVSVSSELEYKISEDVLIYFALRKVDNPSRNSAFIGYDYFKIGQMMADKAINDGNNNIACFCGMLTNTIDKQFYRGIKDYIENNSKFCEYYLCEDVMIHQKSFKLAINAKKYDAIITLGEDRANNVCDALKVVNNDSTIKIYSVTSKSFLDKECYSKIEVNNKYLGSIIGGKIIKRNIDDLVLTPKGFFSIYSNLETIKDSKQINFLASQSPTSEALNYLIPEFTKKTGITVKIMTYPYQELLNKVSNVHNTKAYDIIRMDMAWLNKFGEKIYKPIDFSIPPFKAIRNYLVDSLPDDYFYSKGKVVSLPFDTSTQLLFYRRDLFENPFIKRDFFEKTKCQLDVPKTFAEFDLIAKYFTKDFNPLSPTKYGTSMIKGSSVAIACEILPRIKAKGISIYDEDGKININNKAIKDAIREFVGLSKYTSGTQYSWWQDSIEDFANNEIAMTIVFGNHASRLIQSQKIEIINKVGYAPIPGGFPMLGGGVIGLSKNTEKDKEIHAFLKWVYSSEITDHVNYLGGYISSKHLKRNVDAIELYPWIPSFKKSFKIGWRNDENINPNFDEFEFEQIFGSVLSSIISGLLSIDEGLNEIQKEVDLRFNYY